MVIELFKHGYFLTNYLKLQILAWSVPSIYIVVLALVISVFLTVGNLAPLLDLVCFFNFLLFGRSNDVVWTSEKVEKTLVWKSKKMYTMPNSKKTTGDINTK